MKHTCNNLLSLYGNKKSSTSLDTKIPEGVVEARGPIYVGYGHEIFSPEAVAFILGGHFTADSFRNSVVSLWLRRASLMSSVDTIRIFLPLLVRYNPNEVML